MDTDISSIDTQSEPKTMLVGRPHCTTKGNSVVKESSSLQTVTVRRVVHPNRPGRWNHVEETHEQSELTNFERKRQIDL